MNESTQINQLQSTSRQKFGNECDEHQNLFLIQPSTQAERVNKISTSSLFLPFPLLRNCTPFADSNYNTRIAVTKEKEEKAKKKVQQQPTANSK